MLFAIFWRFCYFLVGMWVVLLVLFSPIFLSAVRLPFALLIAVFILATLINPRKFIWASLIAMIVVTFLWFKLEPSNERDWQRGLSKLAWAEINGDEVSIHNVRDFRYRTETDFDENYVVKKVKLSELSSLDLFASYWSGKSIAHIILSFGFGDLDHIAFSIEVRKTKTQDYSTIEGFFRNFELIYVVAEERDLIGLRTIYRQPHEDVYLFRMKYFKENAIKLFLQYIKNMNALVEQPQFYNTLTTNCTTQVLLNAQQAGGSRKLNYDWRLLLSGYTPEYLYMIGNLGYELSIEELTQKGYVNTKDQDLSDARQFSRNIRLAVPRPDQFVSAP